MPPKRRAGGMLADIGQNQPGTGGGCVPMDPSTRVRRTQPAARALRRAKVPSMIHLERPFRPDTPGAPEPDRRLAAQDGSRQEQIGVAEHAVRLAEPMAYRSRGGRRPWFLGGWSLMYPWPTPFACSCPPAAPPAIRTAACVHAVRGAADASLTSTRAPRRCNREFDRLISSAAGCSYAPIRPCSTP